MANVKHIFFDLGGVLLKFNIKKVYEGLAGFSPHTANEIYQIASNAHHDLSRDFESGLISGATFYDIICKELKLNIALDDFKKIYVDIFSENIPIINLAQQLKNQYSVDMISNTTIWHFEYVRDSYPWMKIFEHVITSFEAHVMKPDRQIFAYALNKTQAVPGESVFIDDYYENVAAAREIGMNAIHYVADNLLFAELINLKIKF